MKKVFYLFAGVLLITAFSSRAALAQDPLEVGPNIYKLLYENDRVRVLDVRFNPGDQIAMHSHPDHLAYVLNAGKLRLSKPDGSVNEIEAKAGEVVWIPAESHAAENIGTTEFHCIVIELKEKPKTETEQVTSDSGDELPQ